VGAAVGAAAGAAGFTRQHFLYFLPLPHGQGSFRVGFKIHHPQVSHNTGLSSKPKEKKATRRWLFEVLAQGKQIQTDQFVSWPTKLV
jgi:hypothetical protein